MIEDVPEPKETLEELEHQESVMARRAKDYQRLADRVLKEWMDVKVKLAVKRELRGRDK